MSFSIASRERFLASSGRPLAAQDPGEETLGEDRDIHQAFVQRRQSNRERVDPIVEILAKPALPNELLEWPVGGRDQAEVDFDRPVAPQPLEPPVLEDAEQLGLGDDREIADLIEKQGAVVGQLEAPRLAVVGASVGALLVAEDLGFEQRVGQGRAVDSLEAAAAPAAQLVDHARDDFLARPGRPEDRS